MRATSSEDRYMSRIQNILEKAEREGAVVRMRVADPVAATAVLETANALAAAVAAANAVVVAEPEIAPLAPARAARTVRLDPILVAALYPEAPAGEQYRALRTRVAHADRAGAANVLLVTSPG